jgi:hypothetical protein
MNELYSYHVFMFPFQWQFVGKEMKNKTLEDRTCLKNFVKLFSDLNWKRHPYDVSKILNYNEYNYFYGMVREILFDDGKKDLDKTIIANLSYNIEPDVYTYNITVSKYKAAPKQYVLHIDSIILHLYATGVGVLSFHLNNRIENQKDPESILDINQAGRRLYPPFFGIDFDLIGKQEQYNSTDFSYGLDIVNTKELPQSVSVISDLNYEDFRAFRNPEHFAANPFQFPKHLAFLFDGVPITVDKKDFKGATKKVFLTPLLDDRMYVVCWYGNDNISEELKKRKQKSDGTTHLTYETDEWWYRYMFNDQSCTCQNEEMRNELAKKHTYKRWSDYGTLYGINRYSFVCLTGTLDSLKENGAAFIVNHIQTMYYKMAELCLVQRACLLRFSDEVAGISAMDDSKKLTISERVSSLYKQYLRFVNRIYFREITAQEQGIEMYQMMQDSMKIEDNVKNLDREIQELHEYVSLTQEQKQNRNIEILTIIGAIFILPSFIAGFFGMNIFPQQNSISVYNLWPFLIPIVLSPVLYLFFDSDKRKRWMVGVILYSLLVILLLMILMYIFPLSQT